MLAPSSADLSRVAANLLDSHALVQLEARQSHQGLISSGSSRSITALNGEWKRRRLDILPPSLAVAPKVAPTLCWLGADNYGRAWNEKSPKSWIYLGLLTSADVYGRLQNE